ncbi:hypothetical protein CYMTET_28079, partial [Cymbomonas tetramitiformis]
MVCPLRGWCVWRVSVLQTTVYVKWERQIPIRRTTALMTARCSIAGMSHRQFTPEPSVQVSCFVGYTGDSCSECSTGFYAGTATPHLVQILRPVIWGGAASRWSNSSCKYGTSPGVRPIIEQPGPCALSSWQKALQHRHALSCVSCDVARASHSETCEHLRVACCVCGGDWVELLQMLGWRVSPAEEDTAEDDDGQPVVENYRGAIVAAAIAITLVGLVGGYCIRRVRRGAGVASPG